MLTREMKKAMENPEHKPFGDLPSEVRGLMTVFVKKLLRMKGDGRWAPIESSLYLGEGYIYKIDPNAPIGNDLTSEYPVFCGSDRIWKVDLTPPNSTKKCIRYLVTTTSMRGFDGIRYHGSETWQSTLNIPMFGMPEAVRFRK